MYEIGIIIISQPEKRRKESMRLYRFGGDFKDIEFGHHLEPIQGRRVDVGLVDRYSIDRLTRLVNGGLRHINDLYAVEMALRGLIFHDSVKIPTPSVKIQIVDPSGGEPLFWNASPSDENDGVLRDVLGHANCQGMLCGIDQLIGFSDGSKADDYVRRHNSAAMERRELVKWKNACNGIVAPRVSFDPAVNSIEFVAGDEAEFFGSLDGGAIKRFLEPMAAAGHARYLGDPNARKASNELRNWNAEQYFGALDKGWQEHHALLRRALNIPVPLFLTIVLARAANREDTVRQIIRLREEFAYARNKLWDLFDEADFRIFDSSVSARILKDIEGKAAAIIPKWRKARDMWFPFSFDLFGRFAELNALGLLKDAFAFLRKAARESLSVDATALVRKQLDSVELRGLIERHLTIQELEMIEESVESNEL